MSKSIVLAMAIAAISFLSNQVNVHGEGTSAEVPESLRGLFGELEEFLNDETQPVDLGRLILRMNKVVTPGIHADEIEKQLNALAKAVPWSPVLKTGANAERLNRYLFSGNKFVSAPPSWTSMDGMSVETKNNWLGELMEKGSGNCNSLSSLYLVLGQKLGVPIKAILLPRHVFVRIGDGAEAINIETTAGGESYANTKYTALFGRELGEPYLRPLRVREYIGILLSNQLGHDLVDLLREEEALASFNMAVRFFPGLPDAWANKGILHRKSGKHRMALSSFEKALEIDPGLPQVWNSKGNALHDLLQHEAALEAFDKALALDSTYSKALEGKTLALLALGRRKDALALDPDVELLGSAEARDLGFRAAAMGNFGRHEEALPLYDQALNLAPNNYRAMSNKGNSLAALGRLREALECYDKALTIKPGYASAIRNKGVLLAVMQRGYPLPGDPGSGTAPPSPAGDVPKRTPGNGRSTVE